MTSNDIKNEGKTDLYIATWNKSMTYFNFGGNHLLKFKIHKIKTISLTLYSIEIKIRRDIYGRLF